MLKHSQEIYVHLKCLERDGMAQTDNFVLCKSHVAHHDFKWMQIISIDLRKHQI